MRKILVFVSSLDGKITKWGNPSVRSWSSKADQDYFRKVWNDSKLIVIGSKTYNAEKINPSSSRLIVVMTRHPADYKNFEVTGQIEFSEKPPGELTVHFEKTGYNTMIVAGGPKVATSFLKDNLIDEVWLTVEPKIFGTGGNFVAEEKLNVNLRLISCEKVNQEGTMIMKYKVE